MTLPLSPPEEPQCQEQEAILGLLSAHDKLLASPVKDAVPEVLMSSKVHRAVGQDRIMAELIRATLPLLIFWITFIQQWSAAYAHVAKT